MQKATKANLLDHFYSYLAEEDWLEGVDLYQAGRVGHLSTFEGLISAHVTPGALVPRPSIQGADVRLKIHPAGNCIQWIECTCRKNRALGQYCEHIAAFMIHVDREHPELFGGLDASMPLKPPTQPRRTRTTATPAATSDDGKSGRGAGATQTIIDHLKGSIHGVSLVAHGPTMRVRIEIRPGHLTHYDLSLDAAAKFLAAQGTPDNASAELRDLQVVDDPAELGTRIYQPEPEVIIAERIVAQKMPKRAASLRVPRLAHVIDHCQRMTAAGDRVLGDYMFIPAKAAARYLGEEWLFLPGRGYQPLTRLASRSAWSELPLTKTLRDDAAAEFAATGFKDYLAAGPVYLSPALAEPVILETPELAEINILAEGDGWFRLDPRYGKGKASISMIELMKQWHKKRRKFVRSGEAWLRIPDFVTQYNWQLDEAGDALKVDALGLLRLKAAVGDFDRFVGSKKHLETLRNRLEFAPISDMPALAKTGLNLRHYQETGVQWLWWLYQNNLHGLLADEMGLGKTHQAMAMMMVMLAAKPEARFLVICPTTVLDHWLDKVEQYAPNLAPRKYHGTRRTDAMRDLDSEGGITLITSYGVMLRDIRHLAAREWEAVILDEAHFVKNNDTATYQAACRLRSRLRICLTGTPMENHLGELKNLFDFLVPGYLGSDEYFRRNFLNPLEKAASPTATLALQKLIHPFKMRRTKENVLPDLPAKVEDLRHCGLSEEQVRLYREIVAMKAKPLVDQLKDESTPIPYLHVFATLTLLKQVCDHPALISADKDESRHESGKFELLKELLDEALGSGHKVVIFSQYVGMIQIITRHLAKNQIKHVTLTGQSRNRGTIIKAFQEDNDIKIFVGSLLAGGIGIDLTAASVVIHYDRWWNATKENQATDRVHRIGQNKNVQVLKLVTRGTLEEKIDRMIASKRELFSRFLDEDEEIFKTLSRQELIELLQ